MTSGPGTEHITGVRPGSGTKALSLGSHGQALIPSRPTVAFDLDDVNGFSFRAPCDRFDLGGAVERLDRFANLQLGRRDPGVAIGRRKKGTVPNGTSACCVTTYVDA